MSRPKDLHHEARKAAALFWARAPREKLTPDQRRAAYRVAMQASMTNCAYPQVWRQAALNMLPFED